jgi:hypothetical protein
VRSAGPVRIVFSSKTISFDPLATEASYPEGERPASSFFEAGRIRSNFSPVPPSRE